MLERRRGALDKAVAHLTTALTLVADGSIILGELGAACLQQGKNQKTVVYLTHALDLNPLDLESRYYLQLAEKHRDGRPAPALAHP
jgi:tetratricopeptide (TPR) repeat protein